jgi:hypothetical protein
LAVCNEDVKINLTNRRWAVIRAADDPVGTDERGQPTPAHRAYYMPLWDVVPKDGTITDEVRRVLHYLRTLPLTDFDPLVAPLTGAKQEASESGDDGLVQARVANAYTSHEGPFRFNLLTAEEVAKHVRASNDKTLTEAMQEVGCRKLRRPDGRDVQVTIDKTRPRLWAINQAVAKHHATTDGDELVSLYKAERAGRPAVQPMQDLPEREPWDIEVEEDFGAGDSSSIH